MPSFRRTFGDSLWVASLCLSLAKVHSPVLSTSKMVSQCQKWLVCWCFEPSQPVGIISGLPKKTNNLQSISRVSWVKVHSPVLSMSKTVSLLVLWAHLTSRDCIRATQNPTKPQQPPIHLSCLLGKGPFTCTSVSYTHLTLPTRRTV